jgi:hypothetical protein
MRSLCFKPPCLSNTINVTLYFILSLSAQPPEEIVASERVSNLSHIDFARLCSNLRTKLAETFKRNRSLNKTFYLPSFHIDVDAAESRVRASSRHKGYLPSYRAEETGARENQDVPDRQSPAFGNTL